MALEPITRQEKIIAGQDLEPITRMEMFLKNFGGGGGSVPKPLTYDYMPEGYPKKTMGTVTLMEEQEVAFSAIGGAYGAKPTNSFILVLGQTYTVNWDGTEYEFVASLNPGDDGKSNFIGNLAGEPFAYMSGVFFTTDPSPSHTISVKTIQEVVTPMAEEFLPNTAANKEYVDAKFADGIILPSSTAGSTKKFKITVDDSGTISATEVT